MLWEEWRRLIGLILQTKPACDWKHPALCKDLCPSRRWIHECQVHHKHHRLPWPSASLFSFVFDKSINDVPEKNKNLFHIRKFCPLGIFFAGRKKKKWERSSSVLSLKWYVSLKAFSLIKMQSMLWDRKLSWINPFFCCFIYCTSLHCFVYVLFTPVLFTKTLGELTKTCQYKIKYF